MTGFRKVHFIIRGHVDCRNCDHSVLCCIVDVVVGVMRATIVVDRTIWNPKELMEAHWTRAQTTFHLQQFIMNRNCHLSKTNTCGGVSIWLSKIVLIPILYI